MFTFNLKPGQEQEYEHRHAAVWPELLHDLYNAGWRNYTLFRRGLQIYAYAECHPDAETALKRMASSRANRDWAAWFTDVIDRLADEDGSLYTASEVWHMDEEVAGQRSSNEDRSSATS